MSAGGLPRLPDGSVEITPELSRNASLVLIVQPDGQFDLAYKDEVNDGPDGFRQAIAGTLRRLAGQISTGMLR